MVFNVGMTDAELIASHGGSTAVAKRLGLSGLNGARRVNNWTRRGIPALVKLNHPWLMTPGKQRRPECAVAEAA